MTQADDTQSFNLRLPRDLYEKLRLAAFEQRTSMNALIVDAVRVQQEAS
jgi:predicted HicB family RNase H-like nuclease